MFTVYEVVENKCELELGSYFSIEHVLCPTCSLFFSEDIFGLILNNRMDQLKLVCNMIRTMVFRLSSAFGDCTEQLMDQV